MAVLITSYLALVFLLPLIFSGIMTLRALPRGTSCPRCRAETSVVVARLDGLLRRIGRPIARRWCLECGWEGFTRRAAQDVASTRQPAESARPNTAALPPQLSLDVRSLQVDGLLWRVQLQWWRDVEWCQGRLVFIEGSGRRVRDGVQCFRGATQFEVLGQALSIPDGLLASRLRQLLTTEG